MNKLSQEEIETGNARVKKWLQRFAPSMHSNYVKFNQPFEFHDHISRAYAVHAQFAPEFKHLHAYQKFLTVESDAERFKCLIHLINLYYAMKNLNECLKEPAPVDYQKNMLTQLHTAITK